MATLPMGTFINLYPYIVSQDKTLVLDDKYINNLELIFSNQPVVLTGTGLCSSALKWDVDYLTKNMGTEKNVVFLSSNKKFKYCDDHKIQQYMPDYNPPIKRLDLSFKEFIKRLKEWKTGDVRLYLQQALNTNVGEALVADFVNFDWRWLNHQQKINNWGPLTSNLLLVGMEGNITPVHYDEQQNFFSQLIGYKRCLLFSPKHYDKLYPHPVYHPCDRQSKVDFDDPDFNRFPGLDKLEGYETILGPGDVLYIPMYWWHQIESKPDAGYTVSVNFWYKLTYLSRVLNHAIYPDLIFFGNIQKHFSETLQSLLNYLQPLSSGLLMRSYSSAS
ncbi:unnamed protein product, partial [Meganyctiphanes norvegica]